MKKKLEIEFIKTFDIAILNPPRSGAKLQYFNIAEAKIRLHSTKFFASGISIKQTIGDTYDYFEARTDDLNHVFIYGPSLDFYWWNSTDYRNKFSGDLGFGYDAVPEFDSRSYQIRWAPRYRVNNHLFMTYVISHKLEYNNIGRAFDSNYTNLEDEQGNILFSKRKSEIIYYLAFFIYQKYYQH